MAKPKKTLDAVLSGRQEANLRFIDLCGLLQALGFEQRVKDDHHIFTHTSVAQIINLQPRPGGQAKPYQVRQIRQVITKYRLGLEP